MGTILEVTWDSSSDGAAECPDDTGRQTGRMLVTGGGPGAPVEPDTVSYTVDGNRLYAEGDANDELKYWCEFDANADFALPADWSLTVDVYRTTPTAEKEVGLSFGHNDTAIASLSEPYWTLVLSKPESSATATLAFEFIPDDDGNTAKIEGDFTWLTDTIYRFSLEYSSVYNVYTLRADTAESFEATGSASIITQHSGIWEYTGGDPVVPMIPDLFVGNSALPLATCFTDSTCSNVWVDNLVLTSSAVSSCSDDRVRAIIEQTRQLFNDGGGGFISDAEIISWAGSAYDALASAGYFKKETYLSVVSDTTSYDLLEVDEDLVRLYEITDVQQKYCKGTTSLQNYAQLQAMQKDVRLLRDTLAWFVNGTTLMVAPSPNASSSDRYKLYYSYLPTALSCAAAPLTPKAFDDLYVYSALAKAFEKDRHAPGAMAKVGEYRSLKDLEIKKVARSSSQGRKALRPYI